MLGACDSGGVVGKSIARELVSIVFFNDTAPTEIYTLSLHDALPICVKSATAAAKITISYFFEDSSDMTVLYISSLVVTLMILRSEVPKVPYAIWPHNIVTFASILLASSAIAFPILPELKFVITRIGSMYSIVLPAVTKTFLSSNIETLSFRDS